MVFGLKAAICTTLACACTPIRFNISVALTITRSSIDYLISHEGRIKNHVAALHIGSLSRENDFVPVKVLHRPPRVWPIGHLEVSKGRKMGVSTQIIRQCRAADRLGSEPFFNELYFFFLFKLLLMNAKQSRSAPHRPIREAHGSFWLLLHRFVFMWAFY